MRRWSLLVVVSAVSAIAAGCATMPEKGSAASADSGRLSLPSPSGMRAAAVACVASLERSGVFAKAPAGRKPVVAVADMPDSTWWDVDSALFAQYLRMELLRSGLALSTKMDPSKGTGKTALGVAPDFTLGGKITVEQRRNADGVPLFPRFVARLVLTDVKTGFAPWEEVVPLEADAQKMANR